MSAVCRPYDREQSRLLSLRLAECYSCCFYEFIGELNSALSGRHLSRFARGTTTVVDFSYLLSDILSS